MGVAGSSPVALLQGTPHQSRVISDICDGGIPGHLCTKTQVMGPWPQSTPDCLMSITGQFAVWSPLSFVAD